VKIDKSAIKAIGISYQMHGLIIVDKNLNVLRPAILWCDSRAVEIGDKAFQDIGAEKCLSACLNSPGNFTASKLKWVKENQPDIYKNIYKAMLPGDYLAMKLTGKINTTATGLSEGILWDFEKENVAKLILDNYGISPDLLPEIFPVFSNHGTLSKEAAKELGLHENIIVSYRAGDVPNNAFSLNVLEPGDVSTVAGTSGIVYGVTDQIKYDKKSRINTFLHVNHTAEKKRLGVLLCTNGAGNSNNWMKNTLLGSENLTYEKMNELAMQTNPGADDLFFYPFGNGAERSLGNKNLGASFYGIQFNKHKIPHMLRAVQEGIIFFLYHGLHIMKETGINVKSLKAGKANMFLSPLFTKAFASITNTEINLYNTDGAQGSARGAGMGAGIYKDSKEAFKNLEKAETISPDKSLGEKYQEVYSKWVKNLQKNI
ncbi:MAG: carbohydrate kinase, partial [Cytophagaceae bacterium]|nr:carbohydrate kinase [Cytophagaceae bacterium]